MSVHLNVKEFQEALASEKPMLVDFFATWCGPCRMMAPIVDEIATAFEGKAIVGKVDVDECMELAEEYGISTVPSFLFFKNGALVHAFSGLSSAADLEDMLNQLCD